MKERVWRQHSFPGNSIKQYLNNIFTKRSRNLNRDYQIKVKSVGEVRISIVRIVKDYSLL